MATHLQNGSINLFYIVWIVAGVGVLIWAWLFIQTPNQAKLENHIFAPQTIDPNVLKAAIALMEDYAKPVVRGRLTNVVPSEETQSFMGGSVYLPKGEAYPHDSLGDKMVFLIQVNLADTPDLPGLPPVGIIQLFARADCQLGASANEDVAFYYWPNPSELLVRHEPIEIDFPEDVLLFRIDRKNGKFDMAGPVDIHRQGRVVSFEVPVAKHLPSPYDFPVASRLSDIYGKMADWSHLHSYAKNYNQPADLTLGGYPVFSQSDPRFPGLIGEDGMIREDHEKRSAPKFQNNILTLHSDLKLMIWDGGTLNLMTQGPALDEGRIQDFLYEVSGH